MIFRYPQTPLSRIPKLDLNVNNTAIEKVENFDFLGLVLNEKMSWTSHISKVSSKISAVIGIMSRSRNILDKSVLLKIYKSIILPRLHYSILCWGFDTKNIFKIQKKAIRLVCKAKYNSHTDPLFRSLNLLKVNDIFQAKCVSFFYKYENNNLPSYFNNMFKHTTLTHSHNTRNRDQPIYLIPNNQFTKKSIRYFIPNLISELPTEIKSKINTHALFSIKQRVKSYFIGKYKSHCTKRNCYVCQI